MVDQNHHYYKLAAMLYPKVVDGMVARGEIAPPEADVLMRQLNGPAFTNFVMNVINQIPTLAGEQHMERLIYDNLTVPLVQDMRQQMAANPGYGGGYGYRGGGYGYRAGGYGGGGGWYGRGNPGYGGGGGFGGPSTGGWFGRPNGGPRTAFSARGPGQVTSRTPQQTQQTQTAKPEPKKEPVEWKTPELIKEMNQDIKLGDSVGFAIRKFTASDGCNINEVFVVDDRPIYKNDQEAIQAYKHLLGDDATARKFITVCYRQLKVIKVDRPAFKNLIRSVATAIGNIGEHDVAGRFRVLLASSADHPSGAVEAFNKMIVDEFNSHGLCGELLDSVEGHSTWKILASSVHGIYDMLSNNLSKETRETLHQIKNFDEALRVVAEKVLNTVVMNGASQKIFDPLNDTTIMDIYGHAVPPVWRNESKGTWEATENLFAKYLASKKRIDGSTPETAVVAQQSLKTKLGTIDKNYAVMQVPRIITWCNCPSSSVVGWDNGKCVPRVFGADTITNDTTFLIDRAIRRVRGSKITAFMGVSSKLICEVDEGSINLDYGVTSDGAVWVGCLRYR